LDSLQKLSSISSREKDSERGFGVISEKVQVEFSSINVSGG
jgi:hypothetical protein